jgi:hypothetical protein
MRGKPKKKLCWNCEGSSSLEEENCSFCGVYLNPLSPTDQQEKEALFAPPYRIPTHNSLEKKAPAAPYAEESPSPQESEEAIDDIPTLTAPYRVQDKATLYALLLILPGSVLFLFGLTLLLFADAGRFTLYWNSDYWYCYLFSALLMLGFGWRFLQQEEVTESNR